MPTFPSRWATRALRFSKDANDRLQVVDQELVGTKKGARDEDVGLRSAFAEEEEELPRQVQYSYG
ncbi:hypothetical protein N0V84_008512 [Fusarium piperis]|uniref:Uncharacterized protein n=1 Tax=Fusarium piperis TaxID=1435070 RepID=A0A9W9BM67_9HYPO|nr:hypothetical protein N0V84_008512 [Fusarium piperis]